MDSFVHVANWSHTTRPLGHFRSHSSMTTPAITSGSASPPASPKSLSSPKSRSHLEHQISSSTLSTVNSSHSDDYNDELSTLPDPRSRSMTPARNGSVESSHHPDLSNEVATLSTKLINAINHQTILDDTLSATRHELETANERIVELEAQNASHREILSGDVWVRRTAVEVEKKTWLAQVAEEKAKRLEVEKAKKLIEQELENLTAALFEEANKMVIRAKEEAQVEHDIIQRKNDQLKAQLADSESLLKSQQEQLSELKQVMETITSEHDDYTNNTAPSSPGVARLEFRDDERFSSPTPTQGGAEALAPGPPTSFPHLIQPVLRFDITTYDDFLNLTKISKMHTGSVRVSSGSLGGLSLPSLGLGGSTSSVHLSNGSTASLGNSGGNGSAPHSPSGSNSLPASPTPIPHIRDTRFYKRVLAEDIEPTLRLDIAPGLSWLARRSVMTAITDGSLVVEPVTTHAGNSFIMSISKPHLNPCSLCGESRKDALYLRNHRFRTSEQDSAQRYPLCKYCLNRVRSTCDFLSFLRMVKDGHWKAEDDDQEKAAWEESVRHREQMFWARLGGGVIPCTSHGTTIYDKSPRPSMDQLKTEKPVAATEEKPRDSGEDSPDSVKFEDAVTALPESEDSPVIPITKVELVESIEEVDSASEPPPPPPKDDVPLPNEDVPSPKDDVPTPKDDVLPSKDDVPPQKDDVQESNATENPKIPQTPPEQTAKE